MDPNLELLRLVCNQLEATGTPYMLTGSFATHFYCIPRMTQVIDIIVELRRPDISRFLQNFQEDFYVPSEAIAEAIERHSMFHLIHEKSGFKVDFIIRKEALYHQEEFQRRRRLRLEDFEAWVASPEDLVLPKTEPAKDTSPEIAIKLRELFKKKTPLERVLMGCSMYTTSRYLITHAILRKHPNISKAALRRELFLCYYGNDFAPEEREKIIQYLEEKTTDDWEPY